MSKADDEEQLRIRVAWALHDNVLRYSGRDDWSMISAKAAIRAYRRETTRQANARRAAARERSFGKPLEIASTGRS